MAKTKRKQNLPPTEITEPITACLPSNRKKGTHIGQPAGSWTQQDQARYGPAPLLPYESEERYVQIHKWLERGIESGFEYHLKKEMVDNVWKRQRWEHAETALTNRLARQLTEVATPPTLSDLESGLSQLSISQLVNLPAPRQLSRKASAKFEPPSPLRAVATVKIQSVRAALLRRSERASKCYNANSDLMVELRQRRAQLVAMDRYNGLAQLRVPNSVFDADAEKITPHFRRQEQLRQRFKNRIIYATRDKGWTAEGRALFGSDFLLRSESSWSFANLYLDVEELFDVEQPGDALIVFEIAKETWRIRRLNEAAHQLLLMTFDAKARKYLAQHTHSDSLTEDRASSLIRELVAAGSGPNVLLAEALQEIETMLDNIDQEIERAYGRRLDHCRRLTRLRGKKLQTEFHRIQGAGYHNRGEWESR